MLLSFPWASLILRSLHRMDVSMQVEQEEMEN
jgi:hypothetical protein